MSKNGNNSGLNKVFSSPYKDEIERRLAMGQSTRAVSKWLETRGETISYGTLNNYKKEHFNIDAEASKIIKQKQDELKSQLPQEDINELAIAQKSLLETDMNMHLAKVRAVNHVSVLYDNIQQMREYIIKLHTYEPVVAAHAAKGLFQEIRATIETLEKIKEKDGDSNNTSVARALSSLKKQSKEMADLAEQRRVDEEAFE
jgi:hypothetical protein